MRYIVTFCLFLIASNVYAGTFIDDFSDGNVAGWKITVGMPPVDIDQSTIEVQDGKLFVRRASGRATHLTMGDDDSWADYTIECDMRITEKILNEWNAIHYAGFAGRFRSENLLTRDVVWFTLNLRPNPSVWKGLVIHPDQWIINDQVNFNGELNTWYHIKMVVEGNKYGFFVDDVLTASIQSSLIPSGRVGVLAGGCAAEFDNIIITGDDVPDIEPSGYEVNFKGKLTSLWGQIKEME